MGVHVWDTCEKRQEQREDEEEEERRGWREHWEDSAAGVVQGRGWGSGRVKDRHTEEGEIH